MRTRILRDPPHTRRYQARPRACGEVDVRAGGRGPRRAGAASAPRRPLASAPRQAARRGGAGRRAENLPEPQQQRAISIAYHRAAAAWLGEPGGARANGAARCKRAPPSCQGRAAARRPMGKRAITEGRNGAASRCQGAVNAFQFKAQPPRPATVGAARDAGRPRQGQGRAGQGSPAPPQRRAPPRAPPGLRRPSAPRRPRGRQAGSEGSLALPWVASRSSPRGCPTGTRCL